MKVQVTVNNSLSQIQFQDEKIHAELTRSLRFKDQAVEFSYESNLRRIARINELLSSTKLNLDKDELQKELRQCLHIDRDLSKKLWRPLYDSEGYFPTGLLKLVEQILQTRLVKYDLNDLRVVPKKEYTFVLKESLPPLRYYQKIPTKSLLEEHRGVVVMPTGTGKTKTACRMVWDLGVKTLVIVPSKALVSMMMGELTKYFGKGKVSKLTTKSTKTNAINVINVQALINLAPEIFHDIKAVIIDEFHHAASDTYLIANEEHLKNCYYRVGLTATNFRNDGAGLALESVLSSVLYEYTVKQAIKDGFLMKPEFRIIRNSLNEERTYKAAYQNQIVENDSRNKEIADIALRHSSDSVLILVKQVDHGERLEKLIKDSYFIHGETKDSERDLIMEKFRKGQIKRLIGTSVIGEGVDLPRANVLVMAGGGKSKLQVIQNIGRILRVTEGKSNAIVYDFADLDGSWLEEHSTVRHQVFDIY